MLSATSDEAARLLSRHALPLGLKANSTEFPWDGARRATFTLLRLGGRHVFVTCAHVLGHLRDMQSVDLSAELVAYLAPAPCMVELNGFTLVDEEARSLDVAVFRGREDEVHLPGMHFIDYNTSYLADPRVDETVFIVGYPGSNVQVEREYADFGYMFLGLRVSSVSDRQITLANEFGAWCFEDFADVPRDRVDLGGLSGSPAFVIREGRHRFVGIVTECSEEHHTIFISRLGCLNSDGSLNHAFIPW